MMSLSSIASWGPRSGPGRATAAWTALQPSLWAGAGLALLVLVWTATAHYLHNAVLLPPPISVAKAFVQSLADRTLFGDVAASLRRVFFGFLAATALAVPAALMLSYFVVLRRLLLPIISLLRPIPPIAWIPIAILWFGVGDRPSYFITAIAAFFPIFLNSYFGGVSVDDHHLHAAKTLGAKRSALVVLVILPSALPMVWTGIKIGLGQSWMAVVTAELIAAQSGLGYMIQVSRLNLDTPHVLVGMAVIGVLGALMSIGLGWLERYVLPWKQK